MINLFQSNRLSHLSNMLAEQIAEDKQSPLAETTVLVQSPGMSQWLKIKLAELSGISANIRFPLPSSYIWQLYQTYLTDIPEQSDYTKVALCMKIMDLLPDCLEGDEFKEIKDYLHHDPSSKNLFQLSAKIADVYDQYLIYRSDWIEAWEQGDFTSAGTEQWQGLLWNRLVAKSKDNGVDKGHRVELHKKLVSALSLLSPIGKKIHIFGISALPPQQLELFNALATSHDVNLYWLNPCEQYWGDLVDEKTKVKLSLKALNDGGDGSIDADLYDVGHPLLSSWGKQGRDFLEQLLDLDPNTHDLYQSAHSDSLLSELQRQIHELDHEHQSQISNDDSSLVINSCHTRLREVEVLHDYLLQRFNEDDSLSPKDIIVMMPDVADYLPYIRTVFGVDKELSIPFSVSDHNPNLLSPLIESFFNLLSLPESRFTQVQIADFLEVPAIRAKFCIEEQQLEKIYYWLEQVNIRWGIDGKHKSDFELPEVEQNTWRFGLSQLLGGYAVYSPNHLLDSQYCANLVEGQDAELLGALIEFFDVLEQWRVQLAQEITLNAWRERLLGLMEQFYEQSMDPAAELSRIREWLQGLDHLCQYTDKEVDLSVIEQILLQEAKNFGVYQGFWAGKVNFCSLMPMRSIPFKHICLLGMNDGEYPRDVTPLGFDLIGQNKPRRGDRSRRLDDKYLFLEAIMSAQESFYISYLGRSDKDNKVQLPSILVSELIDYVDESFITSNGSKVSETLITSHPLQPFSDEYFKGESKLKSFSQKWFSINQGLKLGSQLAITKQPLIDSPIVLNTDIVDLSDLLYFWSSPTKAFLRQSLKLTIPSPEETKSQDEVFSLEGLAQYHLKDTLVSQSLERIDEVFQLEQAKGNLPVSEVGRLNMEKVKDKVLKQAKEVHVYTGNVLPSQVELTFQCEFGQLQGWVQIYSDQVVMVRTGQLRAVDRLKAWIIQLLLVCSSKDFNVTLFAEDYRCHFDGPTKADAQICLGELIKWYKTGMSRPIPFDAEACYVQQTTGDLNKVESAYSGNGRRRAAGSDPYMICTWPRGIIHLEEFFLLSELIFKPLVAVKTEAKYSA